MHTLNWRTVREITLQYPAVPDPNNTSQLLSNLKNVRVAFDGALVHIDPRRVDEPDHDQGNTEFPVYAVPASSVRVIHYMETKTAED